MAMLVVAFQASTRVVNADIPTPLAGELIVHKHCEPESLMGTFSVSIDFEFEPDGIVEVGAPVDEDTAFDQSFEISCGDGDSETADGDTVSFAVGDLGGLVSWYSENQGSVDSATVTIRETGLPEGVTATYEGCDFDEEDIAAISSGWACTITNTFDDPDDGNGNGNGNGDGDCPACACCGLDLDIDNDNRNIIGIDNDNTNDNDNANENENDNENTNENENDNTNTNAQDQDNHQDQDNENDQTNNITSSPEVNIDSD